jgi:hypothetical protein
MFTAELFHIVMTTTDETVLGGRSYHEKETVKGIKDCIEQMKKCNQLSQDIMKPVLTS